MSKNEKNVARTRYAALCLTSFLAACGTSGSTSMPRGTSSPGGSNDVHVAASAAPAIDAELVQRAITTLASDAFEGRGAAQPGGAKAAHFIASEFARIGLEPLGDRGDFLQRVPLVGYRPLPNASVTLDDVVLAPGEDFIFLPFFASRGRPLPVARVTGELVFVGYGLDAPTRDDLADLALQGRIAILLNGVPDKMTDLAAASHNFAPVIARLAARGAAAVLVVGSSPIPKAERDLAARRAVALVDGLGSSEPMPPVVEVSQKAFERVFAASGWNLDEAIHRADALEPVARALGKSAHVELSMAFESDPSPSDNVVGVLRGSDSRLREEAVMVVAHHDAYGREPDGRIFPGAGDDAVGVGDLLGIAEGLSRAPRPRRSIVFLATTGEETWKLGSFFWANHPTWPLARVVAALNLDSIASESWGPLRFFYSIGHGQSSLAGVVEAAAHEAGIGVIPDPLRGAQLLQRSDAYELARRGIPTIYGIGLPDTLAACGPRFGEVLGKIIHYEGDRVGADWHWPGVFAHASLYLRMAQLIANDTTRPTWSPDSPFRTARSRDLHP